MRLTVRLFAGLRERAGTDRLDVDLPRGATVADLLAAMASTAVGPLAPRSCVVAVNREYAAPGDMRTTARARAYRDVAVLADTSTIAARPAASRCVSAVSTYGGS